MCKITSQLCKNNLALCFFERFPDWTKKKPTETPWKRLENPTEFCNLSPKRHFVSTSRKHKSKSTKAFSVSTITVCFTGLSVCYHASFGSCAMILFAFLGFFFRWVGSRQSADCTWSEQRRSSGPSGTGSARVSFIESPGYSVTASFGAGERGGRQ